MKCVALAMLFVHVALMAGCAGMARRPVVKQDPAATGSGPSSLIIEERQNAGGLDASAGEIEKKPVTYDGMWVHEN